MMKMIVSLVEIAVLNGCWFVWVSRWFCLIGVCLQTGQSLSQFR